MSGPEILKQSIDVGKMSERDFVVRKSKMLRVLDGSSGVYLQGSPVTFDLASISRGDSKIDFKNSFLEIPIVMQATLTGDANFVLDTTTAENAWAMTVKGSNLCQVQSFNLIVGDTIVSNSTLNAMPQHFEYLCARTEQEARNLDDIFNFGMDSSASARYSSVIGMNNNAITGESFAPTTGVGSKTANSGRIKRGQRTASHANDTQVGQISTVANNAITYRGRCVAISATQITWQYLCIVPLRLLHDVFDKVPLFRNSNMQLQFFLNSPCTCNVSYATASGNLGAPNSVTTSIANVGGAILPFQVSALGAHATVSQGTGLWVKAGTAYAGASSILYTSTIGKDPAGANAFPTLSVCRLALNMVELTDESERIYRASGTMKEFSFLNWMAPRIIYNVAAAGGTIMDQLVQNNVYKLRKLLIVPVINTAANGSLAINPLLSPFGCEGPCPTAGAYSSNVNVTLNGTSLYENTNSQWYSYEHFVKQIRPQTLQAGMVIGQGSGAISLDDWERQYGYIVVNLAEHEYALDSANQELRLTLTNQGKFAMDYYCFVAYEQACSIDVDLGVFGKA